MTIKSKWAVVNELTTFLWSQKLWWMVPLVLVLVVLGIFLLLAQGSVLAPFIYTLF
jgi:hypothetical protein